jgi:hypothetical protein
MLNTLEKLKSDGNLVLLIGILQLEYIKMYELMFIKEHKNILKILWIE